MPKQHENPSTLYQALVKTQKVQEDERQRPALEALDELHEAFIKRQKKFLPTKKTALKSLYIWGEVGRGKSMLMDLFYENIEIKKKQRVHFHAFMQYVHVKLHEFRQKKLGDPVAMLIKEISETTDLLCFDEMQATDVTDASILFRLFEGLFENCVTIVSTSNKNPENIYTGGVQRERFDKFVALLKEKMQVISLNGEVDYRRNKATAENKNYFYPLGQKADAFINQALKIHCKSLPKEIKILTVHGRKLHFEAYKKTLKTSFAELCGAALGAADYLVIAAEFETVILAGIPILTAEKRNEAKRLVLLVDALYEGKCKLIVTAEAAIDELYTDGDGSFEFKRTTSRLFEMQSWN